MLRNGYLERARKILAVIDDQNTDPGPRMAAEDRMRAMIEKHVIKPHEVGAVPTHRMWQDYQEDYGLEPVTEEPRADGAIRHDGNGDAICPNCGGRMEYSGAFGVQCTVCGLYHSYDAKAEADYTAECDKIAEENRRKEAAAREIEAAKPKLNDRHCLACALVYSVRGSDGYRHPRCRLKAGKLDDLRGCDRFIRGVSFGEKASQEKS